MDNSPASISFDVDALGNMEYRIDWAKYKHRTKYVKQSASFKGLCQMQKERIISVQNSWEFIEWELFKWEWSKLLIGGM